MATVYTGSSIVDYLKSIGQPSDFASRAKLAAQYGITNYTGTAEQNTRLLNILRSGVKPTTTTSTTTPTTTTKTSTTVTTTQQQLEAQKKLTETKKQLEGVQKQYQIIQEAKEKGMPITPKTTVEEAKRFLDMTKELEENVSYYKYLTPDNKQIVALDYFIKQAENERYNQAYQAALKEAEKEADPYWREQIRVLKDELERTLGTLGANLEAREKEISTRIKQIEEDLVYEKDYLTAEQQADLAKQKRQYENELLGIREQMAQRGLTISSIRGRAENLLETEYKDITESIQRKYARSLKGVEETAKRQLDEYQRNLEELRRRTEEEKIGAIRKTEAYLGTEELKGIPGLGSYLIGDVYGKIGAEKQQDIERRARGYMTLSNIQGPSF